MVRAMILDDMKTGVKDPAKGLFLRELSLDDVETAFQISPDPDGSHGWDQSLRDSPDSRCLHWILSFYKKIYAWSSRGETSPRARLDAILLTVLAQLDFPSASASRSENSSLTMRIYRSHGRRIAASLVQGMAGICVWLERSRLMNGQRKVRGAYVNQNEKPDSLGQEI